MHLAFDPDTGQFRVAEVCVALQAEADGVVTTSMRGSLSGPRSGGGADCINADGVTWAAKNSRDIRSILKATNG
jgi:hypothetical protein